MLLRMVTVHSWRPWIISARPGQHAVRGNFCEAANRYERRCVGLAVSAQIATRTKAFVRAVAVIGFFVGRVGPTLGIDIGLFENGAPEAVLRRQYRVVECRAHAQPSLRPGI